jgi:hypothetical protein
MTTIYDWPTAIVNPETRRFRLRAFNSFSVASQTQEMVRGGLMVQRFETQVAFPILSEEDWREVDGLFAALRGIDGFVRLWDPARTEPYYNKLVTETKATWDDGAHFSDGSDWVGGKLPPFVSVAETRGRGKRNVVLKGFPPSLQAVLRRADLIEIWPNGTRADHGHLYEVTARSNTNSNGETLVQFEPDLRRGIRPGDAVLLGGGGYKPSSVFSFAGDDDGEIEVRAPSFGSFGARFVEVLPYLRT